MSSLSVPILGRKESGQGTNKAFLELKLTMMLLLPCVVRVPLSLSRNRQGRVHWQDHNPIPELEQAGKGYTVRITLVTAITSQDNSMQCRPTLQVVESASRSDTLSTEVASP